MSSQSDYKLELESQFILRLPQERADALRQAIRSGEPLSKRLSIKFEHDIRHGIVKFDNHPMLARLYDLPTITESYKTLDRKNFYKTADVSQILICKDLDNITISDEDDDETKKAKYDKAFSSIGGVGKREFLYPHGITPPLKNVRKRRFRKTLRKRYVDFSEIEKEVKRLCKFDCEAIDTRYEIVEETKADKVQPTTFSNDNASSPMESGPAGLQSNENSQNIDLHDLFGEEDISSDESDEDDDDDDGDDDLVGIEEEDEVTKDNQQDDQMDFDDQDDQPPASEPPPAADIAAEIAAASDLISQTDGLEEKRQELNKELTKTRERILNQENQLRGLDNQALRMRLQTVLDSLLVQESEIIKKLDELGK